MTSRPALALASDADATTPVKPPKAPFVDILFRRVQHLCEGDVFELPADIYTPVPATTHAGNPTYAWQSRHRSNMRDEGGAWRWIYDADDIDTGHPKDDKLYRDSLPVGFRAFRVSDDRNNQGDQHNDLVIAMRELDPVSVQVEV